MSLSLCLKIAGTLQLLLAAAHIFFPRRFGWKEQLARLSLLNRQIFLVHCLFIVVILVQFGALSLFFTELLLQPGQLARVVLWGLLLFWALRLIVQWWVYDPSLWKGDRFKTTMHLLFTGMWTYCVTTYGLALWRQYQF